jgi:hypothetical protein
MVSADVGRESDTTMTQGRTRIVVCMVVSLEQ